MRKQGFKIQNIIQILLSIAIAVALNFLAQYFYYRIDLTKEKRYTLSDASKQVLQNINETVTVKIFLDGNFPAGFRRLQSAIKDMMYELHSRNTNIEYEFINPDEGRNEQERQAYYVDLNKKGILPVNLSVNDDGEKTQKIIFPGAIISYKGRTLPVNLLENQIGFGPEENLNNSISMLEYKFVNTMDKIMLEQKPFIGILSGYGTPSLMQIGDIIQSLKDYYRIDTVSISDVRYIPQDIKTLLIIKPQTGFADKEKYKIDQYIMNGGKVLWMLDKTNADMHLFGDKDVFMPNAMNLNLDDQLFKYGVRINDNVLIDLQCDYISLVTGKVGNNPQIETFKWFYFPVLQAASKNHIIVKNLDAIGTKFVSSIDTVKDLLHIKKTPLLSTSRYSRAQFIPMRVSFDILKFKPEPSAFNQPYLNCAYLLEGKFTSLFKNRMTDEQLSTLAQINQTFKDESVPTKQIVIADGDIAINEISKDGKQLLPLGLNQYTKVTYSNLDFINNCIEYLVDEKGVIGARNKEWKLRLLDKNKAKLNKVTIQAINLVIPLILLIIFGIIFNYIRHKKYS
jgi:ABC-2 type transport system permease protein